jgi:hypothetical protein
MNRKTTPKTKPGLMPDATEHALNGKSTSLNGKSGSLPHAKRKEPSVSQLKKKCWQVFSLYIRMRDCLETTGCTSWGLCVTCFRRYHIKLLQAGHFIPGRHNANLFSERGVHAQCYNCNVNLKSNPFEYRRQIIKLYGEGADLKLEKEARQIKKFSPQDLIDLMEHYKNEIKKLENLQ